MSTDIWNEYDAKIRHWRPEFANNRHIHARDVIEQINKKMPTYERLKEDYQERQAGKDRRVSSKRLDAVWKELTSLKKLALELMA
jgi:hypothetical protein